MSAQWFRSWHGAPTDTKWRMVARRANVPTGHVTAIVWVLLDRASQAEPRGSIAGYDPEEIAAALDLDPDQVVAVISELEAKSVLCDDFFTGWSKHQPMREDGSAERARAWRESKKTEKTEEKQTHPNAIERNRPIDTDTDTDTDSDIRRSAKADSSTAVAADPPEPEKPRSKKSKAAGSNPDDVAETYRCWNLLADHFGLPKANRLTDARKAKIRQRLKDAGGIEAMKDVMRSIQHQAFLLGDNDRGWKLSIDSFLQASTFTKIQEGSYVVESNRHSRNGKGVSVVLAGMAKVYGDKSHGDEPGPDMGPAGDSAEVVDADWSETQLH